MSKVKKEKIKGKGKKLRREERIREKEKEKGKNNSKTDQHVAPNVAIEELTSSVEEDPNVTGNVDPRNSETGDIVSSRLASPDIEDKHVLDGYLLSSMQNTTDDCPDDGLLLSKKRVLVIMKFLVEDSELTDVAAVNCGNK
ncbi:hypothetical protein AgCh_010720 [Apium graveolens]